MDVLNSEYKIILIGSSVVLRWRLDRQTIYIWLTDVIRLIYFSRLLISSLIVDYSVNQ